MITQELDLLQITIPHNQSFSLRVIFHHYGKHSIEMNLFIWKALWTPISLFGSFTSTDYALTVAGCKDECFLLLENSLSMQEGPYNLKITIQSDMGRCKKPSRGKQRCKGTGVSKNGYYQGAKYEGQAVGKDLREQQKEAGS